MLFASSNHIDVVVDDAGAKEKKRSRKSSSPVLIKSIGEERLKSYKDAGLHTSPKLGFTYCSGTWVHGSSNNLVSDHDVAGTSHSSPCSSR